MGTFDQSRSLPPVAGVGEIVGGPQDGQRVGVVNTGDCALTILVDWQGQTSLYATIAHELVPAMLRNIAVNLETDLIQRGTPPEKPLREQFAQVIDNHFGGILSDSEVSHLAGKLITVAGELP